MSFLVRRRNYTRKLERSQALISCWESHILRGQTQDRQRRISPTRCVRLHKSTTSAGIVSTRCGRGAKSTRGRMSGARCLLLLMRDGMFVCLFAVITFAGSVFFLPIVLPLYPFLPSQVSLPSPPYSFHFCTPFSLSLCLFLRLHISPCLPQQQTLTPHQQLRLWSLPTCRRGTLDGGPQDPHPHPAPSQPCMAQAATTASQLEEPIIREMPSINKVVRPAAHSHTSPSTLTSPTSLAGTGNIAQEHIRRT